MSLVKSLIVFIVCVACVGSSAVAASSNYWQDVSGNFNGGYSDAAHWIGGTAPTTTDTYVFFTNNQLSAYTVQLTEVSTSGVIRVTSDVLTVDLNGFKWWAPPVAATDYYAGDPSVSHFFGGGVGETAKITISSSSAPSVSGGNTLDLGSGVYGSTKFGNTTAASTIVIDDSLGFGAKVVLPWNFFNYGANIIISGAGSELSQPTEIFDGWGGNILVKDGGLLNIHGAYSATVFTGYNPAIPYSTTTVNNATLITSGTTAIVGYGTTSTMIITNNGLWRVGQGGLQTSYLRVWSGDPYLGKVVVTDNSTIDSVGDVSVGQLGGGYSHDLGSLEIRNNSKLISSNGNVIVHADTYTTGGATYTNRLVLDTTSSIVLGDATHSGTITNRALFIAGGTITGQGPGKFLLQNEGQLEVGGSVGMLTLENGDLVSAAGSKSLFEFEAGNYDQIVVENGDVTIDGDMIYSFFNSYNPQVGDLFYFVIADQINFNPSSDNMAALMSSKGWAPGSYEYGVVPFGSGQALQLAVPEPTTVSLLALGGWMLLRRRKN